MPSRTARRCRSPRRAGGTTRSAAPLRRRAAGCRRPGWDGSSCTCLLQRRARAGCDQPVPRREAALTAASGRGHEGDRGAPRVAREEAAVERLGVVEPLAYSLHIGRRRQLDGPAHETGTMRRRARHALALPRVEAEVMVVAAGAHERGRVADLRLLLEADP